MIDRVSTVQVLRKFRSHFVTVQARQADVQEDVVRPLPAQGARADGPSCAVSDIVPEHFEQLGRGPMPCHGCHRQQGYERRDWAVPATMSRCLRRAVGQFRRRGS